MKRILFFLFFGLAPFLSTASAGVISRDWQAPGDGLLTYDDVNRREWLDLSQTLLVNFPDLSVFDVIAELDPGRQFEGFSVAAPSDVSAFAQSAGIETLTLDFDVNGINTGNLIDLLSPTVGPPVAEGSLASFVVGHLVPGMGTSFFQYRAVEELAGLQQGIGAGGDFIRPANAGVMLYRNTVPEPASWLLLLIGSGCLFRSYVLVRQ
jgi:hypothetical protein